MIDLKAIKARIERTDEIREAPWNPRLPTMAVFEDRKELVAEVERLLERAQRAEAALQEAVAREAVLLEFLARLTYLADGDSAFPGFSDGEAYRCIFCQCTELEIGTEGHAEDCEWVEARKLIEGTIPAAAARLERLAELENQVAAREADLKNDVPVGGIERMLQRAISMQEELRGALQAALTPLEAAAGALVPPGARVEETAALVDEALTVIHEELG